MTTHPGISGSPETHSRTGNDDLAESRAASSEVKIGGMCCAINTGNGKFAGNEGKSRASASGPPVETPIATTCGVENNRGRGGRMAGAGNFGTNAGTILF